MLCYVIIIYLSPELQLVVDITVGVYSFFTGFHSVYYFSDIVHKIQKSVIKAKDIVIQETVM
jgi:hypothetical protein